MRHGLGIVFVAVLAWVSWTAGSRAASPAPAPTGTPVAAAPASDAGAASARPAASPASAAGTDRAEALRQAAEQARLRRTLATGRPALDFENTPVRDVLEYLAQVGRFSIVLDPALAEAGIDLATRPVTLRAKGLTYEDALNLLLPRDCGYRIEPGYVQVTTLERSWLPLRAAVYSIRLALSQVPDFTDAPRFDISQVLAQAGQTSGAAGGGLWGTVTPAAPPDQATPDRIVEFIKKFVRNQNDRRIAPWDDEGGPATIQYIDGRLIVTQTDHGHRAVARLLAKIE